MYLSITTTYSPATDLGYLLHKHPDRVQSFPLSFGQAHVFYPEATEEVCTAVLLLDIDPIGLVRGEQRRWMDQYVNDRPYVASSFLSVAMAQVYSTALNGRCQHRPELVEQPLPLIAKLPVVPSRGGKKLIEKLFVPLGYEVEIEEIQLDPEFPEWGRSRYCELTLKHHIRLQDLLSHLYVLIPVLDDEKHYWVGEDELHKLFRHGEKWLPLHPERELIATRYLKYRKKLAYTAIQHLSEQHTFPIEEVQEEDEVEKPLRLHELRMQLVVDRLKESGAKSVLDLGCGEGKLLRLLMKEKEFTRLAGVDVSYSVLQMAQKRLNLAQTERVELWHGSLLYRDQRWKGFDAATLIEVIEHIEPDRLPAFEQALFGYAKPRTVILTTPNAEYNVRFAGLSPGKFRHPDHRFEWTRQAFQTWAQNVAKCFGYRVTFFPVGPIDEEVGSPTQMAIFQLEAEMVR